MPTADAEVWEAALRKHVITIVSDPRADRALRDGLAAPDLRERRLFWQMCLEVVLGRPPTGSVPGTQHAQITILHGSSETPPSPSPEAR